MHRGAHATHPEAHAQTHPMVMTHEFIAPRIDPLLAEAQISTPAMAIHPAMVVHPVITVHPARTIHPSTTIHLAVIVHLARTIHQHLATTIHPAGSSMSGLRRTMYIQCSEYPELISAK